MRIVPFALVASVAVLAACGGAQSSQANNSQANISNDARPENSGAGSMVHNAALSTAKVDPGAVMRERHDGMEQLGKSMKALHRALDSSSPDINAIRAQTATMASIAAKIPSLFPVGTGPEAGKTRAKPEIWRQQGLFLQKSKDFLAASRAIDAAARSGDVKRVMALHDNVDKACKACHDPFRAPEH